MYWNFTLNFEWPPIGTSVFSLATFVALKTIGKTETENEKFQLLKTFFFQREREKEEKQALYRSNMELSKRHYQRHLLSTYGLTPLKNLVLSVRRDSAKSQQHFDGTLTKKVFLKWFADTKELTEKKNSLADSKHNEILLKRSMASWKKVRIAPLFI